MRGTDAGEVLNGTDGADIMIGYGGGDILYGTDGDDTLMAVAVVIALSGGDDDDRLYGDGGWDALSGGAGDDTLYGGSDSDQLHGNEGADIFVLKTDDSGSDAVIDFTPSAGDKIRMEAFDGKMPATFDAFLPPPICAWKRGISDPAGGRVLMMTAKLSIPPFIRWWMVVLMCW